MAVAVKLMFWVLEAATKLAPTDQPVPPGALSLTKTRWMDAKSIGTDVPDVPGTTLEAVN